MRRCKGRRRDAALRCGVALREAAAEMRPCLRAIVEAREHSFCTTPFSCSGRWIGPVLPAIGSAVVLELLQVHTERRVELGDGPGENTRSGAPRPPGPPQEQ